MDFYITKEEVVKALNTTLGVVEKRQTLPILANVLFDVDETKLKLTATDLESEISTISTISNFKSGGRVTAPAKKLSELCRLFSDLAEIHFYLDGDNLKIETSSGKYNLATLPSEDFPVFDQKQESLHSEELLDCIFQKKFQFLDYRHQGRNEFQQDLKTIYIIRLVFLQVL